MHFRVVQNQRNPPTRTSHWLLKIRVSLNFEGLNSDWSALAGATPTSHWQLETSQRRSTKWRSRGGVVVLHAATADASLSILVYSPPTKPGQLAAHGGELGPCGGNAGHVAGKRHRRRAVQHWRWLWELAASCLCDDPHDSWSCGRYPGTHGDVPRGLCQGNRPWVASGWDFILMQIRCSK